MEFIHFWAVRSFSRILCTLARDDVIFDPVLLYDSDLSFSNLLLPEICTHFTGQTCLN